MIEQISLTGSGRGTHSCSPFTQLNQVFKTHVALRFQVLSQLAPDNARWIAFKVCDMSCTYKC